MAIINSTPKPTSPFSTPIRKNAYLVYDPDYELPIPFRVTLSVEELKTFTPIPCPGRNQVVELRHHILPSKEENDEKGTLIGVVRFGDFYRTWMDRPSMEQYTQTVLVKSTKLQELALKGTRRALLGSEG